MTIREYVSQKLSAFGLTEAHFADLYCYDIDPGADYSSGCADAVGKAMCNILAELLLLPIQTSISENGFSETWDFDGASKYYIWLCKQYGVEADDDIKQLLGITTIIDRTNRW